jgi:hypothetical protein
MGGTTECCRVIRDDAACKAFLGIPLLTNLLFSPNLLCTSVQEPSVLTPGSRLIRSRASVAYHCDILSGYRIRPNTDVRPVQLTELKVRQVSAIGKVGSLGSPKVHIVGYGVHGKAPPRWRAQWFCLSPQYGLEPTSEKSRMPATPV